MIKVFKFGLLQPTANFDMVKDQMYKGHKYQNELVKIENDRRKLIREAAGNINSDIKNLEESQSLIDLEVANLLKEIGNSHSEARNKSTTKDLKAKMQELRAKQKEAYKNLKDKRVSLKKDPLLNVEYTKINNIANELVKTARKNNGLYWGTGGLKENALEAACKKQPIFKDINFKRWDGNSKIGIQIQTQNGQLPTTISDVYNSKCTLIKIDKVDPVIFSLSRKDRKKLSRTKLYFRIGTVEKKITPIWAEFPMIMHRQLPENGIITNATVSRNIFGQKEEWTVELTVKYDEPKKEKLTSGKIAIDVGWRKLENELRIGTWKDTNGNSGFINLPEKIINGLKKVNDIKEIRTNMFNVIKEYFMAYIKANNVSEWLQNEMKHLHSWKSINRLAAFVKKWQHNILEQDDYIYEEMEKWRYKDFHLWNWEANQRRSSLRYRKDFYRNLANKFSNQYEQVIIEDFNLSDVAKKPALENNEGENETANSNRYLVAISELKESLILIFKKENVLAVDPNNTSKKCNKCGSIEDIGQKLNHICTKCGEEYDRDENAAANILERGCERLSDGRLPGTARKPVSPTKSSTCNGELVNVSVVAGKFGGVDDTLSQTGL